MIILRAFPLSFSILWRFLIVLPFLLVFLVLYVLLSVFWGFFAALISPLIAIGIILAMTFVMAMIPMMVGTRLGLQARGEAVDGSYVNLFLPSLGYGAFEAVTKLIVTFGAAGLLVLFSGGGSATEVTELAAGAVDPFSDLTLDGGVSGSGWLFLATSLIFVLMRAALLPAFAGGAAGRDPNGQFHTPFSGVGSGFIWLVLLIIIIYLLGFLAIPAAFIIATQFGLSEVIMARVMEFSVMLDAGGSYSFAPIDAIMAGIIIVYLLWLFSMQCAGAVLVYERRREAHEAELAYNPPVERMDPDDLREMVRSRMPQRKY